MNVESQIKTYVSGLEESRRSEMLTLHRLMLQVSPESKLWFFDGTNGENKIVTNPSIGYGSQTLKYASGKTKDWFKIGISANTTGISVYILGIDDKAYLKKTFGKKLGKATVTGYCIKFKTLKDINVDVLEEAIRSGLSNR